MKLYFSLLPLIFLFIKPVYSQTIIKGLIIDKSTQQAIPYVNIGIEGTAIGTASYEDGTFKISIPDKYQNDSLTFSAIGYFKERREIRFLINEEETIIELEERISELPELTVQAERLGKELEMGLSKKTLFSNERGTQLSSSEGGAAMALLLNEKKESMLLSSATLFISKNELPEFKLRCRVLSEENGLPGKDLLNESIIITSSVKRGKVTVDLTSFNLILDEPFFLVFEWIVNRQMAEYYDRQKNHRFSWLPEKATIVNRKEIITMDENDRPVKKIKMTSDQIKEYEQNRALSTEFLMRKSSLKTFERISSVSNWKLARDGYDLVAKVKYFHL